MAKPSDTMTKKQISDLLDGFLQAVREEREVLTPRERALHAVQLKMAHMGTLALNAAEQKYPGYVARLEQLEAEERALRGSAP